MHYLSKGVLAWDREDLESRFDRNIDRNTDVLRGLQPSSQGQTGEFDILNMSLLTFRRSSIIQEVYNFRTAIFHRMLQFDHYMHARDLVHCTLSYRDLPLPVSLLNTPDEVILPEALVHQIRLITQQVPFSTRRTVQYLIIQARVIIDEVKRSWQVQIKRMNDDRNDLSERIVAKSTRNRLPAELNRLIATQTAPFFS